MRLDTLYSEELADPRMANVIAQEIPNGKVRVLSPIEGLASKIIKGFLLQSIHK